MWWLHNLKSEHKVLFPLSVLLPLIIVLEIYAPSFEWKVLIDVLRDWLADNFSFLWRLFFWGAVLLVLYGFFLHKKTYAILKELTFKKLRPYRFIFILFVGIIEGLVIFYFWNEIVTNINLIGGKDPRWMGSFFTMVVVAPIAYLIWSFRNFDRIKDLQYTKYTLLQADFHKIEEWATTLLEDKEQDNNIAKAQASINEDTLTKPKTGVLQVAAIYQLLPYLKSEYHPLFARPSMEIYRSLLSSWQWNQQEKNLVLIGRSNEIRRPAYIATLHTIFYQELDFFRELGNKNKKTSINGRNWGSLERIDLKGIDLSPQKVYPTKKELVIYLRLERSLQDTLLNGANFIGANLEQINFREAFLEEADLSMANLKRTKFNHAHLEGANFSNSNLENADFSQAHLEGTNLNNVTYGEYTIFRGADLSGATYDEEAIKNTIMDETTILKDGSHWKPPKNDSDQKPD